MKRVLILGAAGRDFHDFNVIFRDNSECQVVAFTATQIPDIAGRRYPAELAGDLYPKGIPILEEDRMEEIIRDQRVDTVVFAYSDVGYPNLMHLASRAVAAGADFQLLAAARTQLRAGCRWCRYARSAPVAARARYRAVSRPSCASKAGTRW